MAGADSVNFSTRDPVPNAAGKVSAEIGHVNTIVAKYFPVIDIRVAQSALVFRCKISEDGLDKKFISLRDDLFAKGYIPMLTKDGEEHLLIVTRKPAAKYRSVIVNVVLLMLTIVTTILAGAWSYAMFDGKITLQTDISVTMGYFANPHYLLFGAVFFALPLMFILGIHELGHYYMSKRHGVAASLPFFMPVPPYPFSPLGTLGAFISVREPIPDKKSLLDIGIAGPICGFLVALPITLIGLQLTVFYGKPAPTDVRDFFMVGDSLLFFGMSSLFPGAAGHMLHPMAFAGWVGLLVTAINLLPAGQLDGGHIAHALLGSKAKYFSYGAVAAMLVLGLFTPSWFLFAFLIIFLGLRHPPPLNDISRLDARRKISGLFAVSLLLVCFVPSPLTIQEPHYGFSATEMYGEHENKTAYINTSVSFNFTVTNRGNTVENITVTGESALHGWSHSFHVYLYEDSNFSQLSFNLNVSGTANLTMVVDVPNDARLVNSTNEITIRVKVATDSGDRTQTLPFRILVAKP